MILKFKLMISLMKYIQQKELENQGKIEESIKLAIELASITKKLKESKRVL